MRRRAGAIRVATPSVALTLVLVACGDRGSRRLPPWTDVAPPAVEVSTLQADGFCFPGAGSVRGLAVSGDGDVVIAGAYRMTDLGAGPLEAGSGEDPMVARFDAGGDLRWAFTPGGSGDALFRDVAVTASGDVIAVGRRGTTTDATQREGVVVSLDRDGRETWSLGFGHGPLNIASAVALIGDDDVVIGGEVQGPDLFGAPLVGGSASTPFVARLGPDGSVRWTRLLADDRGGLPRRVVSASGEIVVAIGSALIGLRGDDGAERWRRDDLVVTALAVLADGAIVAGSRGAISVLDRDGATLATRSITGEVQAVAVDAGDEILVSGIFTGSIDLGGGSMPAFTEWRYHDGFVARLTARLDHRWSRRAAWHHPLEPWFGMPLDIPVIAARGRTPVMVLSPGPSLERDQYFACVVSPMLDRIVLGDEHFVPAREGR